MASALQRQSAGILKSASAYLLALLWATALIGIVWPTPWVATLAGAGIGLFLMVAFSLGRRSTRLLGGLLLTAAITIALAYDAPSTLLSGLERSVLFAAFLPTLSLIRGAARSDSRLNDYRQLVDKAAPDRRPTLILSGGYAVASFLSVGASAVFASLVRNEATETVRVAEARAGVCGGSLAVMWSPCFVALAVVTEYLPDANLLALVGGGMALSAAGVVVAIKLYSFDEPISRVLRNTSALKSLLVPIAVITAALAGLRAAASLSTIQAMLLVLPPFCLLRAGARGRVTVIGTVRETWESMQHIRDEIAVVSAAMIFGTVLTATPVVSDMLPVAQVSALPQALVVAGCIGSMAVLAFFGMHPLVTGITALTILAQIDSGLSDLSLGLTVLAGWSASSMLSMSSLMVLAAAAQYGVTPERLVSGRNLVFFALFLPIETATILFLDGFG